MTETLLTLAAGPAEGNQPTGGRPPERLALSPDSKDFLSHRWYFYFCYCEEGLHLLPPVTLVTASGCTGRKQGATSAPDKRALLPRVIGVLSIGARGSCPRGSDQGAASIARPEQTHPSRVAAGLCCLGWSGPPCRSARPGLFPPDTLWRPRPAPCPPAGVRAGSCRSAGGGHPCSACCDVTTLDFPRQLCVAGGWVQLYLR